ncbi:Phytochrome-like protein cph2 [Thalassocella blandensis]|nr:Phytochrome-like protein cph2 [Thalassocella blandensis]
MKILLVEDSATIRYAMCSYINAAGHNPIVAESGEEALQILENTPVDMIIMDVEMPGLNGFETTRLIREALGEHWIPIIFVTGKDEDTSVEEGIAAGGDDYLVKPISQVILNAKIRAMERITGMRNELSELNKELTVLSQRDGLTGLFNRRTFEEKAQEIWDMSARSKQPLTIILLDIDHFKLYNDCYGHPAGDECIQKVSAALSKSLSRPGDIVARYGGEEFIAILPNTPEYGARHVTEVIRSCVEGMAIKHRASKSGVVVTISIGAIVVNYAGETNIDLQIEEADKCLYESKQKGRNCCTVREYNAKTKILFVGDCDESYSLLEENFAPQYTMISTSHGDECSALAEEYHPNLIILDLSLEDMNAKDVCRELKENPSTSFMPVILIGDASMEALKQATSDLNANACLQKPLETIPLMAKVKKFV